MRLANLTSSSARRLIAAGALAGQLLLAGCLNPMPDEMPSAGNDPSPSLLLPDAPVADPRAPGEQSGQLGPAEDGNAGSSGEATPSQGLDAPPTEAPTTPAPGSAVPSSDAGAPPADAGPDAN